MSRSRKRQPVVKDHNRWFKVHGRRQFRQRERQALRTGRYDRVPVRPQEASDVYDWADYKWGGWGERAVGRQWRRWFGK